MMRAPLLTLFVVTAGCSTDLSNPEGATPPATDSGSLSTPPPDSGTDITHPQVAAFWSIRGELRVIAGEIETPASGLQVDLWSGDVGLLCSLDVPITGARSDALPDTIPAIFAWWSVDHGEGTSLVDPGCGTWDPGTLELGVGPREPQFDAAMDARDLLAADVYGLYLRRSAVEPVYAVGFAASNDQLLGLDAAVALPPLPDNRYAIASLVVLGL